MGDFLAWFGELMQQRGIIIYFIIFFGKLAEVTISTLRIVLINRGIRLVGSLLAMFEIMLWLVIASNVLTGLAADPLKGLFYAFAFAAGNYIGSWLDEKLAFGLSSVQIVVSNIDEANLLTQHIRKEGYGITTLNVHGMNDKARYMMLVMIRRKCLSQVLDIINEFASSAVVTVSDVKVQKGGYLRNSPTRHLNADPNKDTKWPWEKDKDKEKVKTEDKSQDESKDNAKDKDWEGITDGEHNGENV